MKAKTAENPNRTLVETNRDLLRPLNEAHNEASILQTLNRRMQEDSGRLLGEMTSLGRGLVFDRASRGHTKSLDDGLIAIHEEGDRCHSQQFR